jgi:uncharacterized membrane protein YqiK
VKSPGTRATLLSEAEAAFKKSSWEAQAMKLKAGAQAEAKKLMAEADAAQIKLTGDAEASKISAIGKATAEAYEKQVKAMGNDNFAKFKITEEIGKNGIKIIPEVLIAGHGDSSSPISALLGFELMKQIQQKSETYGNINEAKSVE